MNMPKYPILDFKKQLPADLATLNDYYRIQIETLRSKLPKRFKLSDHERARIGVAAMKVKNHLGQSFYSVTHIYKPDTILGWYRKLKKEKYNRNKTPKRPGRPPVSQDTEDIVMKMAYDTNWSSRKIAAEMEKLGHDICHNTVSRILKENGIDPFGRGKSGVTWTNFIMSHLKIIWACDFFTEEILTTGGLKTCYVLFFIHLATRKVHIAGCTEHPNAEWVQQQARNFSMELADNPEYPCKYLICDNDTSLKALNTVLPDEGIKIVRTSFQSPWQNGYAERFVLEARETLDSLILFRKKHLLYTMKEIARYHNTMRPHQGLGNKIPLGYQYPQTPAKPQEVECQEILGGALKHYYVKKAA